jgi:carotenoid cleavage dioxygenase-like enzyme
MARPFQTTLRGFAVPSRPPEAVTGRLLGIHGGVLDSVQIHHGRDVSWQSHRIQQDASTGSVDRELIVFGGSILAFGHGTLAEQLSSALDSSAPVDVAGQSRRLSACPRRDPISGDLHLLATASDGSKAHVVVSSGALTRRNHPIVDPPNRLHDLTIAGDHVLFAADGFLGIGACDHETGVQWIPTGAERSALVHAHASDDIIFVIVLTPSLERWAIDLPTMGVDREVLDPTPQRLARVSHHVGGPTQPFLWTIGDRTVDTYDLVSGRHVKRSFEHGRPGDFALVDDPTRPHDCDGGWLLGFVHDDERDRDAELVLLDAADVSGPVVASAHIPARIPLELHTTWIPDTSQPPHRGDPS